MMGITGGYDMTIITLDRIYLALSCRLTPLDALSVLHGQRVSSGGTKDLCGAHLH
jgi:hypothetical protein